MQDLVDDIINKQVRRSDKPPEADKTPAPKVVNMREYQDSFLPPIFHSNHKSAIYTHDMTAPIDSSVEGFPDTTSKTHRQKGGERTTNHHRNKHVSLLSPFSPTVNTKAVSALSLANLKKANTPFDKSNV